MAHSSARQTFRLLIFRPLPFPQGKRQRYCPWFTDAFRWVRVLVPGSYEGALASWRYLIAHEPSTLKSKRLRVCEGLDIPAGPPSNCLQTCSESLPRPNPMMQEYNEKVTVLVTTSCMEVYQVLGKSLPHRVRYKASLIQRCSAQESWYVWCVVKVARLPSNRRFLFNLFLWKIPLRWRCSCGNGSRRLVCLWYVSYGCQIILKRITWPLQLRPMST